MRREKFIKQWSRSIESGSASVFIGAGLSRRAGYPDWRTLLKEIADELGLDIQQEHDLAAVAQYSLNRAARKRTAFAKLIAEAFPPQARAPIPFQILARLPIRHIWTTNYDTLPELAWSAERKQLDIKSRNADLSTDSPWAHAILYKMHGSVDHPTEVVIAKDDYELYRRDRPGFLQALAGQLVTKQILFLGFSFTDPNLTHLFANIRETFHDEGPEHYALVCKPRKGTGSGAQRRFETDKVRHALWVEDLQRYGIQCIELDTYEEIDEVLQEVELRVSQRSVFVSGSFVDSHAARDATDRLYVEDVARHVGRVIAARNKRLASGFGLVVGSATIAGALGVVLAQKAPNLEQSLLLRPFPRETPAGVTTTEFRRLYRESMIQQSGICVFVAGLKEEANGVRALAKGVMEEFETAKALGRVVIPIGATGGAAAEIWKLVGQDFARLCRRRILRDDFDKLNDRAQTPQALAAIVKRVIENVDQTG